MKESYVEGLANPNGPESYGGARKDATEALTGERVGPVWSREKTFLWGLTPEEDAESHRWGVDTARRTGAPRGQKPGAAVCIVQCLVFFFLSFVEA